ncbi:MAG: Zn-dependent oligopeptidase, partial [Proteobacteria bacterium]|nr:Zn-dependent oligopeptidase [Pseudomonadota bacterium]
MDKRLLFIISSSILAGMLTGCCGAAPPKTESMPEPAPETAQTEESVPTVLMAPVIWATVPEVEENCAEHLEAAKRLRDELVQGEGDRTVDNTLKLMNDLIIELDRVLPMSDLIANVSPDKTVRTAAEACQREVMKFVSELELDRGVYDALAAVKTDDQDPQTKRFLKHLLRDYRRSGVDKDETTRNELKALVEEMVKTGQEFSRAIREDKRFIEVTGEDLAGLPEDFVHAHIKEGTGRISTDYPDFFPVVTYAKKGSVRRALYMEFLKRAYPANETTLKKLLELRYTYATTLGYSDWAEYAAEEEMVKNKKTIAAFIDKVAVIARPRMEQDLQQLLARKKKDNKKAKTVRLWDRFYYVNKIKAEEYGVDSEEVRAYFDYPRVKEGLLAINQELFGVTFQKVQDAPTWYEGVEAYDVVDGDQVIARFYLDMHPREGKYGHAAMFSLLSGVTETQLPAASLVCNFPTPSGDGPALMEHGQVVTFFHEFGHLMHHLLAGRHDWATQSGISCESDFVEVPSQLLEEWPWSYEVLKRFAVHYQTGKPIPAELVEKMRKSKEFGKGIHVMRQMFYASLSLNFHDRNPDGFDLLDVVKKNQQTFSPYPYEKGTYVYASFGHLAGYTSRYYTYMWSLMLAKDLFTKFDENDMMNKEILKAYKDTILAPGGSIDAADMV